MQVDATVGAQCVEVVGAAIVLIDEASGAVADHERRVATGTVGDAGLDVDGDAQVGAERQLLAVVGSNDVVEAERADLAFQLASWKPGDEHPRAAIDVIGEPCFVEVVGVEVRDVEKRRVLDALHQLGRQLVVARKHEPRSEEGREEPRVAQDRAVDGVDQDAGMADGGSAHLSRG